MDQALQGLENRALKGPPVSSFMYQMIFEIKILQHLAHSNLKKSSKLLKNLNSYAFEIFLKFFWFEMAHSAVLLDAKVVLRM